VGQDSFRDWERVGSASEGQREWEAPQLQTRGTHTHTHTHTREKEVVYLFKKGIELTVTAIDDPCTDVVRYLHLVHL